jgi:IS1 family transposase
LSRQKTGEGFTKQTSSGIIRGADSRYKQTRQIIAFHVGDRSHESAKQLWTNLPAVYREQATFYTDQYAVYTGIIPAAQHKAITKHARKTNHIERFNNTLRQRVSRLVRDTLAFSSVAERSLPLLNLVEMLYQPRAQLLLNRGR